MPNVEKYTCPLKESELDLAIYDLRYLKEEIEKRSRTISQRKSGEVPPCEVKLAKIFPLRIGLGRTRQSFKEFIIDLLERDAMDWLNTLNLEELASLLEKSASADSYPIDIC